MAQFDLFANADQASAPTPTPTPTYPYLLEVQADLLAAMRCKDFGPRRGDLRNLRDEAIKALDLR